MADEKQKQESQRRAARVRPDETHVLVRSRRPGGFNRGGFRWSPDYVAVSLDEIAAKAKAMSTDDRAVKPAALLKSILEEPALDTRLITTEEAEDYLAQQADVRAGNVSPEEMRRMLVSQQGEIDALKKQLSQMVGDRPPKQGELPEGSRPSMTTR